MPDTSELTIRELIGGLRPSHLWAIVIVMASLIGGAFTLGTFVESYRLQTTENRRTLNQAKEEFYVRYLRYLISRQQFNEADSDTHINPDQANTMFIELIGKWYANQTSFDGKIVLVPEISKADSDPTNSKIVFSDGSKWRIPPEVKRKVLHP